MGSGVPASGIEQHSCQQRSIAEFIKETEALSINGLACPFSNDAFCNEYTTHHFSPLHQLNGLLTVFTFFPPFRMSLGGCRS